MEIDSEGYILLGTTTWLIELLKNVKKTAQRKKERGEEEKKQGEDARKTVFFFKEKGREARQQ